MKTRDQSELVNIGRIGAAVGLRGEVRVSLHTPDSDNLKEGKVLLLKHSGAEFSAKCLGVRRQSSKGAAVIPVIRLEGIADRDAAEALRGMEIYITADDLEKLPEGQHYVRDLIGYTVYDRSSGREIGKLNDVIQNTAQNVLDIESTMEGDEGRQILVPAVDEFLKLIDDGRGVIELELIPGFI